MKSAIEVLEIPRQELDALLEHARTALPDEDYRRLKAVIDGLSYLTELIADKNTTIRRLRQTLGDRHPDTIAAAEGRRLDPDFDAPQI